MRARFGGRFRAAISGGARLDPEVGQFFLAMGILLMQGYGQTEAGPVIAANPPDAIRDQHGRRAACRAWNCGSPRMARSWSAATW